MDDEWTPDKLEAARDRFKAEIPYWTSHALDALTSELRPLLEENRRMRDLLGSVAVKVITGRPITVEETDRLRAFLDGHV